MHPLGVTGMPDLARLIIYSIHLLYLLLCITYSTIALNHQLPAPPYPINADKRVVMPQQV